MRTLLAIAAFTPLLAFGLACTGLPSSAAPGDAPKGEVALRTDLEGGCYGQPGRAFSKKNFVPEIEVFARTGEAAWDFELPGLDGGTVHLADLLADKPVVLFSGSYTCPVYQKMGRKIDEMARRLGDRVHVVVVYGPEAHPKNDNSPYRGDNWAIPNKFSDHDLATSLDERKAHARKVGRDSAVIEAVEPMDNPFWCTYGTAPNAAYLIGTDGRFHAVHDWFDAPSMIGSIQALIGDVGSGGGGDRKRRGRKRR